MSVEYIEQDLREPLMGKASSTLKEVNVFKISPNDLKQLFFYENSYRFERSYMPDHKISKSLHKFKTLGGSEHFLKSLLTEAEYGIIGDNRDLERRISFFGKNSRSFPQIKSFAERLFEAATTGIMANLFYTATLAMLLGVIALTIIGELAPMERLYFLEGISIYMSIIFVTIVSAADLYLRDNQFLKLVELYRKEKVPVLRGRDGYTTTRLSEDLVVGDIIFLDEGQRVPADCILLSSFEMTTDERLFIKAEKPHLVPKKELTPFNFEQNPNPFLFSQSVIVKGQGKALVCAVGQNTFIGSKQECLTFEKETTPTQERLIYITENVNQIGIKIATICFLALIIHMGINIIKGNKALISLESLQEVINHASGCIALAIVACPEGLILAVSLGVAFQVQYNHALIRCLSASEKLGGVQELLFSKTGVLTQNKNLRVANFYTEGELYENSQKNKLIAVELEVTKDILIENILYNTTDCRLEMDEFAKYKPEGNQMDCCLIEFLQDNEIRILPDHQVQEQVLCQVPFNSERCRATTAIRHPQDKNLVRVLSKGAPELVFDRCTKIVEKGGKISNFHDQKKGEIMQFQVVEKIAIKMLKPIAFAYKDMTIEEYNNLKLHNDDFQSSEKIEEVLEEDMVLVGVLGIEDPLREGIQEVVKRCKEGGVTLRLITNENLHCARAVALRVGIIDKQMGREEHVCIDGQKFRDYVGGFRQNYDELDQTTKLEVVKQAHFKALTTKMRVMARCDSEVKATVVTGLLQNNLVAITGAGINDVHGLELADVGLSLGNRMCSEASKDASKIVLLNDDFGTILDTLMWGRAIYINIRKFIQLQITMNIVILTVQLIGSVTLGDAPLTPSQLLWVNIIMDTLGVLALATEPPTNSVLTNIKPLRRDEPIMTPAIKRNIVLSALYQIVLTLCLLYFGATLFNLIPKDAEGNYTQTMAQFHAQPFYDENNQPTTKCELYTIIFNCIALQTIFQMINARKTGDTEFNVFENFFGNWIFVSIFLGVFIAQLLFVQLGGPFLRCAPLDITQNATCFVIGASVILVVTLIKLLPAWLFEKIPFAEVRPAVLSTNKDYQIFQDLDPEEQRKLQFDLLEENQRVKQELAEEEKMMGQMKFLPKPNFIGLKANTDLEKDRSNENTPLERGGTAKDKIVFDDDDDEENF